MKSGRLKNLTGQGVQISFSYEKDDAFVYWYELCSVGVFDSKNVTEIF